MNSCRHGARALCALSSFRQRDPDIFGEQVAACKDMSGAITSSDDAGARKLDGASSWRVNPSRRGPRQQHDLAAEPAGIDPCMNLTRGSEGQAVDDHGMNGAVTQRVEQTSHVGLDAVAFRSLDDVEKIWTLTRKGKATGEQYTADLMAPEKCIIIYRGLGGREIVVDDVSVLHNAACVRVPDAPICWW